MSDEAIHQHAAAGLTRAVHPSAQRHFRAILAEVDSEVPTDLEQCPECGRVGLPERVQQHEC